MECIVVMVTCKDAHEAEAISSRLLEEHLAACVNTAQAGSLFRWKGKIDQADEVLMLVKTRRDLFDAVRHAVKEIHSYDVPEIIAVPVVEGDEDYLNWLRAETRVEE